MESDRRTLLIIGPTPPPYHGGATATRNLLSSRLNEEFRLVHLDTSDRRGLANVGRFDWTNVRLALGHFLKFLVLLFRERPDLVYVPIAQNRLAFWRDSLFLLPARMLGRKLVLHIHGGRFDRFYDTTDGFTRWLIRWIFHGVERVIVLGEGLRSIVRGLVPDRRVDVVPNGTDEGFAPEAAPRRGRAQRRVAYLGTLMKSKGLTDVLDAAQRVLAERDDVRFALAGNFARPADHRMAEARLDGGRGDRIEFVGPVVGADKTQFLAEADLFVFPTRLAEGHPFVVLEAMAAGLPVIATGEGAIPETVIDGETGLIVPTRDPSALAGAVLRLLDDDELRGRMGRSAMKRYLELYTLDAWVRRMRGTFGAVVSSGAGGHYRRDPVDTLQPAQE